MKKLTTIFVAGTMAFAVNANAEPLSADAELFLLDNAQSEAGADHGKRRGPRAGRPGAGRRGAPACRRLRNKLDAGQKADAKQAVQEFVAAQKTAKLAVKAARKATRQALRSKSFTEAELTSKVNDLGAARTTVAQNRFGFMANVVHQIAQGEQQQRLALRCFKQLSKLKKKMGRGGRAGRGHGRRGHHGRPGRGHGRRPGHGHGHGHQHGGGQSL